MQFVTHYCSDILAENCEFFLPHSHLMPSLGVNSFEFLDEFFIPRTRVLGLSVGEDFVILACVVFTQRQRVTGRRTDRTLQRWLVQGLQSYASYSYADAL